MMETLSVIAGVGAVVGVGVGLLVVLLAEAGGARRRRRPPR